MEGKDEEVSFSATVMFKGPMGRLQKLLESLMELKGHGVTIDTVPRPDLGQGDVMIGTWPTPENPASGLMIDTVPLPERPADGLRAITWSTSKGKAGGLMIDTVPLPERPYPGVPTVTKYVRGELLERFLEDTPRFKIVKGIEGGIRPAHLHLENEVVFLDREKFKAAVEIAAKEAARELLRE